MKPYTAAAMIVFSLVALAQATRVAMGWEVTVNNVDIPLWASAVVFVVATVLAIMLWRESRP